MESEQQREIRNIFFGSLSKKNLKIIDIMRNVSDRDKYTLYFPVIEKNKGISSLKKDIPMKVAIKECFFDRPQFTKLKNKITGTINIEMEYRNF